MIHRYKIGNKLYIYKKLNFFSASPPLINSVFAILKKLGFGPKLGYNNKSIWLNNQRDVDCYFKSVKTHNPKHKARLLR